MKARGRQRPSRLAPVGLAPHDAPSAYRLAKARPVLGSPRSRPAFSETPKEQDPDVHGLCRWAWQRIKTGGLGPGAVTWGQDLEPWPSAELLGQRRKAQTWVVLHINTSILFFWTPETTLMDLNQNHI